MSEIKYSLLNHVNAANVHELARCGDDPFCAAALNSRDWVPPSEEIYTANSERRLGAGDKIYCGTPREGVRIGGTVRLLDDELIPTPVADPTVPFTVETQEQADQFNNFRSKENYNVCRPFDEAHAAREGHRGYVEPFAKHGALHAYDGVKGDHVKWNIPPNHGHGAACGCVQAMRESAVRIGRVKLTERPIDKRLIFAAVRNCPWCCGTGRIICDDERAGRVSPSHADGGYAEWQRWAESVAEWVGRFLQDSAITVRME